MEKLWLIITYPTCIEELISWHHHANQICTLCLTDGLPKALPFFLSLPSHIVHLLPTITRKSGYPSAHAKLLPLFLIGCVSGVLGERPDSGEPATSQVPTLILETQWKRRWMAGKGLHFLRDYTGRRREIERLVTLSSRTLALNRGRSAKARGKGIAQMGLSVASHVVPRPLLFLRCDLRWCHRRFIWQACAPQEMAASLWGRISLGNLSAELHCSWEL